MSKSWGGDTEFDLGCSLYFATGGSVVDVKDPEATDVICVRVCMTSSGLAKEMDRWMYTL